MFKYATLSLVILIGLVDSQRDYGNNLIQCCTDSRLMIHNNVTYQCSTSQNATDYETIIVNVSATCLKAFQSSDKVFPKCCPLGYSYNRRTHSCDIDSHYVRDFERFEVLRIGLPHCRLIMDFNAFPSDDVPIEDYCQDNSAENQSEVVRVCLSDSKSVCSRKRCLHKCCPDGYSFVNGIPCKPSFVRGMNLNFSSSIDQNDDFAIIHGYRGQVYLQPLDWEFRLDSEGVFRLFDEKIGKEIYGPLDETYCIEHATKNDSDYGHRIFREFPEVEIEEKYVINGYVMIISSLFLLLTIVFYACSGETKKLFGKTLVSFCVCLMLTFWILIYSTFKREKVRQNGTVCQTIGFLLLYGEFGVFLWLKLLCFDIYYTFGFTRIRSRPEPNHGSKTFLFYSLYGWGMAALLTSLPLGLFYLDALPEPIRISTGKYRCAIDREEGNYADLLFRMLPVSVIQLTNLFLFARTVKCCIEVRNEIARVNDNGGQKNQNFLIYRERFVLVVKLSIVMGLSYMFEVITSFYDFSQFTVTKYLEMGWDIINCLQGLFIFIIFVCKKRMWKNVQSRVGLEKLRKISLSSGVTLTAHISFDKEKKKKPEDPC